jgi:hypothetical protein
MKREWNKKILLVVTFLSLGMATNILAHNGESEETKRPETSDTEITFDKKIQFQAFLDNLTDKGKGLKVTTYKVEAKSGEKTVKELKEDEVSKLKNWTSEYLKRRESSESCEKKSADASAVLLNKLLPEYVIYLNSRLFPQDTEVGKLAKDSNQEVISSLSEKKLLVLTSQMVRLAEARAAKTGLEKNSYLPEDKKTIDFMKKTVEMFFGKYEEEIKKFPLEEQRKDERFKKDIQKVDETITDLEDTEFNKEALCRVDLKKPEGKTDGKGEKEKEIDATKKPVPLPDKVEPKPDEPKKDEIDPITWKKLNEIIEKMFGGEKKQNDTKEATDLLKQMIEDEKKKAAQKAVEDKQKALEDRLDKYEAAKKLAEKNHDTPSFNPGSSPSGGGGAPESSNGGGSPEDRQMQGPQNQQQPAPIIMPPSTPVSTYTPPPPLPTKAPESDNKFYQAVVAPAQQGTQDIVNKLKEFAAVMGLINQSQQNQAGAMGGGGSLATAIRASAATRMGSVVSRTRAPTLLNSLQKNTNPIEGAPIVPTTGRTSSRSKL